MTSELSSDTVDLLLGILPELTSVLQAKKESRMIKVTLADVTVLPTATEARLKLKLSASPFNTVQGSYLTRNGIGTNEGFQYVRKSGTFVFQPGDPIEQEIVIQLKGNNKVGNTIDVVLSNTIQGGSIADGVGTIRFSTDTAVPPPSGFKIAYESNFIDGFKATDTGLDENGQPCWQSRPVHGRTQPGNKELGLYVDPVLYPATNPFPIVDGKRALRSESFPDGVLDINGAPTLCSWDGNKPFRYTAAMINSSKFLTMKTGDRFEFRAALPINGDRGAWPAGWLMPADGSWPPEIDIIEQPVTSSYSPWIYTTTQHWNNSTGVHVMSAYPIDIRNIGITTDLTDFHTYGVSITQDQIIYDLDGKKTLIQENHSPNKSWYILLNMAMGGSWPGSPTSATTFPVDMILDWMRVYTPV